MNGHSPAGEASRVGNMAEQCHAAMDVLIEAGELDAAARTQGWRIEQLAGGWSRHTYKLSLPDSPGAKSYVVRVKPPGTLLETDLAREYHTYRALATAAVPMPEAYGVVESGDTAFGGPFFLMDLVEGDSPVVWRADDRAALEKDWRDTQCLARDLVRTLAEIHTADPAKFGHLGQPRSFTEMVDVWRDTYGQQRLARDPIVEEAFDWVRSRPPDPVEPRLVHGDYRIGNTLLRSQRIVAVLDWELAYLGDPRFDLGYCSLAYLAGKFLKPGSELVCAVADKDWFFAEYERLTGQPVDREVVRTFSALGALALITILLTGIRTYSNGWTNDIRMVWNQYAIPGLRQDLVRIMDW